MNRYSPLRDRCGPLKCILRNKALWGEFIKQRGSFADCISAQKKCLLITNSSLPRH